MSSGRITANGSSPTSSLAISTAWPRPSASDFNVFTQDKFVEKIDYIHSNPVTRGLAEKPEDWPWSSSRHWITGEPGRIEIESHWTWTRRERASTPPIANKAAMNGAPGYCLKTSIHYTALLPAECRVLVFKPGECVLKML
jgi:hypothetical protein